MLNIILTLFIDFYPRILVEMKSYKLNIFWSYVGSSSRGYTNLQAVHVLSTDHYVADLIATLGTADIVLGSVDKTG